MRRLNAHVAGHELGFLGQLLQFLDDGRAFGQPEGQAGAGVVGVNGVEAHLGADLAVVAALGLFQHLEILVELGLVLEGGAVDALELRVVLVALVVGAGDGGELVGAYVAGAHHVRAGAQVNEVARLVVADRLAVGDVGQVAEFELARVARPLRQAAQPAALGVFDGLLAGDKDLLEGVVGLDLFLHLGLDGGEILRRDAVLEFHVVVEAVLDRGPARKLCVGPQAQDGGGHHMGAGVAQPFQLGHLVAVVECFPIVLHTNYLTTDGRRWTQMFLQENALPFEARVLEVEDQAHSELCNPEVIQHLAAFDICDAVNDLRIHYHLVAGNLCPSVFICGCFTSPWLPEPGGGGSLRGCGRHGTRRG